MTHAPNHKPTPPSASAVEAVAALRRQYVAEALDGMIFQAEGAIRLLERGDDGLASRALGRVFDFARSASTEMKRLRSDAAQEGRL